MSSFRLLNDGLYIVPLMSDTVQKRKADRVAFMTCLCVLS